MRSFAHPANLDVRVRAVPPRRLCPPSNPLSRQRARPRVGVWQPRHELRNTWGRRGGGGHARGGESGRSRAMKSDDVAQNMFEQDSRETVFEGWRPYQPNMFEQDLHSDRVLQVSTQPETRRPIGSESSITIWPAKFRICGQGLRYNILAGQLPRVARVSGLKNYRPASVSDQPTNCRLGQSFGSESLILFCPGTQFPPENSVPAFGTRGLACPHDYYSF